MILFLLCCWLVQIPILYFLMYVEHKIKKKSRFQLGMDILLYATPIVNTCWGISCFVLESEIAEKRRQLNTVKKCKVCDIPSRVWQTSTLTEETICPYCQSSMNHYEKMPLDGHYLLAKKLTGWNFFSYVLREAALKEKLKAFTAYNKELTAYQNTLENQLEKYEIKIKEGLIAFEKQG